LLWLPLTGWNGNFQAVGNRVWSGQIWRPFMAQALFGGYATANTDTGHEGNGMDASFALGHPEKVIDYGYRAVHEMTVKSKVIITASQSKDGKVVRTRPLCPYPKRAKYVGSGSTDDAANFACTAE